MVDTPDAGAPRKPNLLRSPAQFLAFGFGSGLSPVAPGTVGTLAAVPIYLLVQGQGLLVYTAFVVAAAFFGMWITGIASRQLNVHDHPGIVWDEFVGYWITLWALPPDWLWMAIGFVVFRLLDVLKPWPVNALDRSAGGGWGIMIDDIVAGLMACVTLHLALWLL